MIHDLGPRSRRIFDALHERILSGSLAPGARLPAHTRLAADFGVAPMTIRSVLAHLEAAGLISRELGRGTFVRSSIRPLVLVLARPDLQDLLAEHVRQVGHRALSTAAAEDALAILAADRTVALVLCELAAAGDADFLRAVRDRRPELPVAIVATSAAQLAELSGTPDCPVLIMTAPFRASQLGEILHLALPDSSESRRAPDASVEAPDPSSQSATEPLRLDGLLSTLTEASLVVDRRTRRVVACNAAAETLLGYLTAEATGLPLDALIPERVAAELRVQFGPTETSPGGPILNATGLIELPLVRADGQEVWVEIAVSRLDEAFVLISARDRTAYRLSQDALSFRAHLLEAVDQAVIATDLAGRILYWNRGAERLYGWSAEEVRERNAGDVIVAPKLLEYGREIMARLREGETWSGEFPVRRRDGAEITVLVTDSPIRDVDGRLVGIIGVAADITDRKRAEHDRLERARLEALLSATHAVQRELSQRLALNVPYVGRLASDPRLPRHLRPIAGVVLDTVREVATRLEHPVGIPEDV